MSNPIIDNMLKRRSVRKFIQQPVSEEHLQTVLECAKAAPTGGNNQLTRFIVVEKPEMLAKLDVLIKQEFAKRELNPEDYQNKTVILAKRDSYHFAYKAPCLIIIVCKKSYGNNMADSANAAENIQLAAPALGLGACWVNQIPWMTENDVIRPVLLELGMEEYENCYAAVILGYPDPALKLGNKPMKENRVIRIK